MQATQDRRERAHGGPRLSYQPGLDGLRGVAVGTVLFYHAGFPWMAGGYLGVSTFFTLSGFLITSLLYSEYVAHGRIDLGAFWSRRFRRIMPASFVTLALVIVFGAFVADAYQREHLRGDGLATLAYGVNWWFIVTRRDYADIFGSPSPLQHFWSLAIEEQFYVLFPPLTAAVLAFARRSRWVLTALLVVGWVASSCWMVVLASTHVPTARLYYGTDTRAAELLAGAVLALVLAQGSPAVASPVRRRLIDALGVVGLLVGILFWTSMHQDDERLYTGGLIVYTLATVALLAATVLPAGLVRSLLAARPLRKLGQISYGVYLYHFPIFLWLTGERTGLGEWPLMVVRLGVTMAVAELSFRFVEWPIRSGERVVGRARWVIPPVTAAAIGLAMVAVTGGSSRPEAATKPEVTGEAPGPPAGSLRIMIVGDSVADNIGTGLERTMRQSGTATTRSFTRRGCGLARGGIESSRDAQTRAVACAAWIESWAETVASFDPEVVVVYTGGWDLIERRLTKEGPVQQIGDRDYDDWLRTEYQHAIDVLSAGGAHVVWISSLCVKKPTLGPVGVFDPVRIRRLNDAIIELVHKNAAHASYIDLFSEVCPDGAFSPVVDGIAGARPDGIHFSPEAADSVARRLAPELTQYARQARRSKRVGLR